MSDTQRWELPHFDELTSLHVKPAGEAGDAPVMVATFKNGDVWQLDPRRLLNTEPAETADWTTARFDPNEPYVFLVDTATGTEEIPAERIWLVCDDAYWGTVKEREAAVGPPGPLRIGIRLMTLRRLHGLTMKELAGRSGLSARSISRIENDDQDPTASALERLLAAMDSSWADLDEHALAKMREERRKPGRPRKVAYTWAQPLRDVRSGGQRIGDADRPRKPARAS